jgi:hypothetical protein
VPDKRANTQLAPVLAHKIERIDAIDVDEARGTGEPKIHRRHEALSASKDLSFLAMRGEEIERIVNGAGRKISKRDGFHEGRARAKQYLPFTLNDLPEKSSCKSEAIAGAPSGNGSRAGCWGCGLFRACRNGHTVMTGRSNFLAT